MSQQSAAKKALEGKAGAGSWSTCPQPESASQWLMAGGFATVALFPSWVDRFGRSAPTTARPEGHLCQVRVIFRLPAWRCQRRDLGNAISIYLLRKVQPKT